MQFGWWALLDRLQLRNIQSGNADFLTQALAVIGQASWPGFLLGAVLGATSNPANKPIRPVIWKSIRWAIGFSLAFYCLEVMRLLLHITLGESLGDIVASAVWFGLAGAFAGLVMELKRTVSPNIGSAPLSFRQLAKWTLDLNRAAVSRVLIAALLGALLGITIKMLFRGSSAWPLMLALTVAVAVVMILLWPLSQKTVRQWLSGALVAIVIFDLLALLALNAMLGTLVGIVVLVGYAIIQSRK